MSLAIAGRPELAGGKLLLDRPGRGGRPADDRQPGQAQRARPRDARRHRRRCRRSTRHRGPLRDAHRRGRIFSAGYDIGGISEDEFEAEAEALVAHPFAAASTRWTALPVPVLCAINGHALGGALELTLAATCVCARGAKLGMPPAKLGLIYGHTGLQRFIDAIGVPRTKELFLTGDNVTADAREQIGLVNQVIDDDDLETAAVELAAEIAATPRSRCGATSTRSTPSTPTRA